MPDLLTDSNINSAIESLIMNADQYLLLVSPYIKLTDRIKDLIRSKTRSIPWLDVTVIFGKNEDNASRSLAKEDLAFLKQLPQVKILYEKRLHAKYYATEDASVVSSMNLHQHSQNNNIELGIWFDARSGILAKSGFEYQLYQYFSEIEQNATPIFIKEAITTTNLLGLNRQYVESKLVLDESEAFFAQSNYQSTQSNKRYFKPRVIVDKAKSNATGFCIRSGKAIPFNPAKPMSAEAYESWAKFKNPDYPEKYCHKTGKPSNGKTSMRRPVME